MNHLLSRILVSLDECRYRLEEAHDAEDRVARARHNSGVDAAELRVVAEFERERTAAGLRELRDAEPVVPRHWLAETPEKVG